MRSGQTPSSTRSTARCAARPPSTTRRADAPRAAAEKKHQYLTLRFGDGAVAGLTLASRDDGRGVRVARARHRDAAYLCGLRKGDVFSR